MEERPEKDPSVAAGHGLILGKFMPPHRGHQWLIEFGRAYAQELTVLVCSLDSEPIPGDLRYQWVREMCPNVNCVHITEDLPQEPADHPEFWAIWQDVVRRHVPNAIDYVFASEDYGWKLAEILDAQYVPVDHARQIVPVSGTAIRAQPMRYWPYLPEPVRPYFLKRVCIFGPESTGKSTLAKRLADHYQTQYAWEYARPLLDFKDGVTEPADIDKIARGQLATETAIARQANRVLFTDTDLLTTTIWSDVLFGSCPEWITQAAGEQHYDLTLLLDVDAPWVDDQQRFFGDPIQRSAFFDRCRAALDKAGRMYEVLSGSWQARESKAIDLIDQLIAD
jgi:NadR type nicotinamide-nucleotide adenylyltransferase